MPPPGELLLISSGTLPATLVSETLRPQVGVITPAKLWDPVWFFIHETVSFLLWFAIGASLDIGLLRIRKTLMVYFAGQIGFAVFSTAHGVAALGWHMQVLSWLAFGVYILVACARWALSKAHQLPAKAGT